MSKRDKAEGLKKFIKYVNDRCKLVEREILYVDDNQYEYYKALRKEIIEWGKSHQLFFNFLLGKLHTQQMTKLLGLDKRQVFRFTNRQRDLLISFIFEKEKELFAKFPFSDWAKWCFARV